MVDVPTRPHDAHKPWRIDVHLSELKELFNALDPSPLVNRDLDDRVEEYIIGSAGDAPAHAPIELAISVPAKPSDINQDDIGAAVRAYFAYLRDYQHQHVRRLLRQGRSALALGLGFLVACTVLGQLAQSLVPEPLGEILAQGLSIIGWVANWRPVEIFLYDWRPMRARARLYDRLSQMTVVVRGA